MPVSNIEEDINLDELESFDVPPKLGSSDMANKVLSPDEDRANKENKHYHMVKIFFIWSFAVGIFILVGTILLHMIFPQKWRWLPENEIVMLQHTASIGIVSAFLGRFGNKMID